MRRRIKVTIWRVLAAVTPGKVKVLPVKIPVKRRATNCGTVISIKFFFIDDGG